MQEDEAEPKYHHVIPAAPGLLATVVEGWTTGDGRVAVGTYRVVGWGIIAWCGPADDQVVPLLAGYAPNGLAGKMSLILMPHPDRVGFLDTEGEHWPTVAKATEWLADYIKSFKACVAK